MDPKKPKNEMTFVGETIFSMEELMKTSMSILKGPITNPNNKSLQTKMDELHMNSKMVLRYEEVE